MKKFAFSLLELSITLIIAAIIAALALHGPSLINSARLSNARALTNNSPVTKIDGLLAWYEASSANSLLTSETIADAEITTWYDISPSSIVKKRNILTKNAASDVTYQRDGINNYPSIKFDTDGHFSLNDFYQGSALQVTLFMVFRPETTPTANEITLFDSSSNIAKFRFSITNDTVRLHVKSSAVTPADVSFAAHKNYITAIYFNDSASAAYVNNAKIMVGGVNIDPKSNPLTGLTIGADNKGSKGFKGLISEIIIYERPLKFQERVEIMRYLAEKYQISVIGI